MAGLRWSAAAGAGRLFRAYERHCVSPDADSVFQTLTAMHSLGDRLRPLEPSGLHGIEGYLALKTLRNFAHHREEVAANVAVVPAPAVSDLAFLCLVRRDQLECAIEAVDTRWRAAARAACEARFHWYGDAVNINPCHFNTMVGIYELLMKLDLELPAEDLAAFETSYAMESDCGHQHVVDGRLSVRAGDVVAVLEAIVAGLPAP